MYGDNETGIRIDEKHTWEDWGLKLVSMVIPMPETKTNYVDVPGADGTLDFSEFGGLHYADRMGVSFVFDCGGNYTDWHILTDRIAAFLHGKRRRVVIDSDEGYYYDGRLDLDSRKTSYIMHRITISGTFKPYKYETESSLDDWLWGPFDFEDGVIREYRDIAVNGTLRFVITGSPMEAVPIFICSAAMGVAWMGKTYDLVPGSNKIYEISVPDGDHELIFTGTGTVSINYQGGIL